MADNAQISAELLALLSEAAELSYSAEPLKARKALQTVMAHCSAADFCVVAPICDAIRFSMLSNQVAASKEARPQNKAATVYFAQRADGLIKIGFASNVCERMKQISPVAGSAMNVLATTGGGSKEEKRLHKLFAASHCHGEWFHPSLEVLEHVELLNSNGQ